MILKAEEIVRELETPNDPNDPMVISPIPNLEEIRKSGAASVDLRLGCWFLTCRQTRVELLDIYPGSEDVGDVPSEDKLTRPYSEDVGDVPSEDKLTRPYYVPFGNRFVLHPRSFVLGVTLEWVRLPIDRAAYVIGRSSWGGAAVLSSRQLQACIQASQGALRLNSPMLERFPLW